MAKKSDIAVDFSPLFNLREAFIFGATHMNNNTRIVMAGLAVNVASNLRDVTPRASGDLAASTWWGIVTPPELVIAVIGQHASSTSGIRYAHFVARGTGADRVPSGSLYQPPSSALKSWVRTKLGVTGAKEVNRTAWAVAKSIRKKGTKPQPYPMWAVDRSRGQIVHAAGELSRSIAISLTDFED